jgi:limonene-1,2-epoxide hydrolase
MAAHQAARNKGNVRKVAVSIGSEESGNGATPVEGAPPSVDVVSGFLVALANDDIDAAVALIDDDIVYENVGLPTIRGKRRFEAGAWKFQRYGLGFDVRIHRIAEENGAVLTERTDAIYYRGYRSQFWVCGTFEVSDGKITLWRDYFDFVAVTRAMVRGLIGLVLPGVKARFTDES